MNNNDISQNKQYKKGMHIGIRGRLMIGFSAITLFFLLAIGITLSVITKTKNFSSQVITRDLPTYDAFLDLTNEVYLSQIKTQQIYFLNDSKSLTELNNIWQDIKKTISIIDDLSMSWTSQEYKKQWNEIKILLEQFKSAQNKILQKSNNKDQLTINWSNSEVIPLLTNISDMLNSTNSTKNISTSLADKQSHELTMGTNKIMENLSLLQITEYVLSIIGIIAAFIIALITARAVLRHIDIFRQHSSRIASGDLTRVITVESNDEMGQLGDDLNKMTKSLATIAKEITQSCHNMVTTLEEVRHAVDMQSSGASEQASSINEITASLSEIEKSSSQTMEKAKSLGEAAERTREKGELGLEAVDQSVIGMKEVREKVQTIAQTILDLSNQTQQVGEITAVVTNLAQQSKMLALNASIEAAKAGEAGKGFAVVAVEVKKLAEQSEQATTQVQKILENIRHAAEKAVMVTEEGTKGVDYGTGLVEQTGEIIRGLNDVIHETTIASQQIESAVRQESAGIEQITTGMNEINQVTTAFVESVKQTTEAMSNLATISKNLKAYVDMYKL